MTHLKQVKYWGTWCKPQCTAQKSATRATLALTCSELVSIAFFFTFTLGSLDANLLVVLLQCGKVLAGLRELTFFHTLADIPMHEGSLRVHQVELVVNA